ncbi:CaiB/BaiF CoA transferase family protein [Actinomadura viridis]|uniref:Crotonobetainyl-CoA:carnitine CoA-transferase CaiB-like acyl-CoA transferase n=1 Tax=Actinomadura viridis TaxID=58110 RepID=A0A931GN76_9ACTN|nr:CoA transferase [Actinomadura viridis]MBG6093467.1 crotonobetainyl-CoA:carnitine CoA-transferase CaiB-like acyl-CoA transferase [Actinomadura viridis]
MALLDGLRVLDLTMWRPGPYTTQLLAQLGADVIKVEPPGGEPMRAFRRHFDLLNQRKRAVVLDLKDPAGRARCLELAAGAEVFVEGFRPGVAGRLGVGHEALLGVNPSLVYCSLSGYGASGPLSAVPGHDVNYRAYAGGLPPGAVSPDAGDLPVADMAAATMAAFAITAACLKARATGAGERIDLGMADVVAHWVGTVPETRETVREHFHGPVPGYGVYATRDGRQISLGVVSEQHLWAASCRALGLGEHADVPFTERLGRLRELDAEVAAAVGRLTRDEAVALLEAAGAPVAPLLTRSEMMAHEHFRSRGVIADGTVGVPVRTTAHPSLPPGPVPGLDEHRGEGWRAG